MPSFITILTALSAAFSFAASAALPAQALDKRAPTTGLFNVIRDGKTVGCLTAVGEWDPSSTRCATFTDTFWLIATNPEGDSSSHNITSSAGQCSITWVTDAGINQNGDEGLVFGCGPNVADVHFYWLEGEGSDIGIGNILETDYFEETWLVVGDVAPTGDQTAKLYMQTDHSGSPNPPIVSLAFTGDQAN